MSTIWWIRRDLRLQDNKTLQQALKDPPILPVFILDPLLISSTPKRRQNFLFQNLSQLQADLRARGSDLILRRGKPVEALQRLVEESGVDRIIAEEDFSPYARLRSVLVGGCLPLKLVQGQLGMHPLAALKANGKPYQVYTPFKKNWLALLSEVSLLPPPNRIPTIPGVKSDEIPAGSDTPGFPAGENAARDRLEVFLRDQVEKYHLTRDRMDQNGTSKLSPYFHFGILGLRTGLHYALRALDSELSGEGIRVWLNQLIWREFYIHILYHFPEVRTQNFKSEYDGLRWRNDQDEFEAWKAGRTGYPIVDAGMRQLRETGWMHNRARMITASFLVKHLLIDWRWGERWFSECLLDGDLAANNGGWQWVAGTGTDAVPYFRIFNPILQSRKFDPEGIYIRHWVPELTGLDRKTVHAPWEKGVRVEGYPDPLVEHGTARERALLTYKLTKEE
jgi:deoxyribodipyrimidine photo-lyase